MQYILRTKIFKILFAGFFIFLFLFSMVIKNLSYASNAQGLTLKATIGKQTITANIYNLSRMEAFNQIKHVYSLVDSDLKPCVVLAQGILLSDILKEANINLDDIENVMFYSDEGHTLVLGKDFLETFEYPMLALKSYQQPSGQNIDWSKITNNDGLEFCFGQTSSYSQTTAKFEKNIKEISITLKESAAFVSLDPSVNNGYFKPGSILKLKGFINGFSSATVNVIAPIGIPIFSKEINNISNGEFYYEIPIDINAMEGKYTVIIFKNNDLKSYIAKFNINISNNYELPTEIKDDVTKTLGSTDFDNKASLDYNSQINSPIQDGIGDNEGAELSNQFKEIKIENSQPSQIISGSQDYRVYDISESETKHIKQENNFILYAAIAALAFFILGIVIRFRKFKSEV